MKKPSQMIIIGAGSLSPADLQFQRNPGDCVAAADAGYLALKAAGITPDLVVGDFDSMPEIKNEPEISFEIIRLPVEKDDTDIVFCIREGLKRGFRDFLILGALGGSRLSHTVANLQLLAMVRDHGASAVLKCGTTEAFLLGEGESRSFPEGFGRPESPDHAPLPGNSDYAAVSVFSLSEESEVSLSGLFYPLDHGVLSRRFPLGISNHFTDAPAKIQVHRGEVLVITECQEAPACR